MMFFNRPFIAIDIGSSAVKIVELSGKGNKKLRAIGLELLPEGAVIGGVIQDQQVVENTTKALMKKLKIVPTGAKAAVAIGGGSLLIKTLGFPESESGSDMHEQIYYEAEQHFNYDMDELYFDSFTLDKEPDNEGLVPVLMVGAKREMVEQYLSIVHNLGMRTGVVDCDSFSVFNMFEYNYGSVEGLIAIVNIGASVTHVTIVNNGVYQYSRYISLGGDEYTHRLMAELDITKENAESIKIAASQGDESVPMELHTVVNEVNEKIVSEIRLTVDYYFQTGEAPANLTGLDNLFMSGGASRTLGLDAAMAASFNLPVQIVNPFHRVDINPKKFQMDYILSQGHLYSTAVGLAIRTFMDMTD